MKCVSSVDPRISHYWTKTSWPLVLILAAFLPYGAHSEPDDVDPSFSPGRGAISQLSPSFFSAGDVAGIGRLGRERIIIGGAAINSFNRYKSQSVESVAILGGDGTYISGSLVGSGIRVTQVLPDGKILVGGNLSLSLDPIQRFHPDLTPDDAFQPLIKDFSPDGSDALRTVSDIHLTGDGKFIITGAFTVGRPASGGQIADDFFNVARLEADGATDMTYHQGTGPNHRVRRSILQEDGKLLLLGDFTEIHGSPAPAGLARLNQDGTIDASFNAQHEFDGRIHAIAVTPDGAIFIGGEFTEVNGTPRNGIAIFDANGLFNTTMDPGSVLSPSTKIRTLLSLGVDGVLYGTDTYRSDPHYAEIGLISVAGNVYADPRRLTDMTSILEEPTAKVNKLVSTPDGSVFAVGLFSHVDGVEYGSVVKLVGVEFEESADTEIPIRVAGISSGSLRISFVTEPGKSYQPVVSVDLGSPNWTPAGPLVNGTGGAMGAGIPIFVDTQFVRVLERRELRK